MTATVNFFFIPATVLIQSSDQASGVVSFESLDDVTLNEPTSAGSADSLQEIRLIRQPGIFGVVNVPFKITTIDGRDNITDLAPFFWVHHF